MNQQSEEAFYNQVDNLYFRICCEQSLLNKKSTTEIIPAITNPTPVNWHVEQFGFAIQRVVERINRRLGPNYITVRYENLRRWSIMGNMKPLWMEFEYLNSKYFKLTNLFHGESFLTYPFKGKIEDDVHTAIQMMCAQR